MYDGGHLNGILKSFEFLGNYILELSWLEHPLIYLPGTFSFCFVNAAICNLKILNLVCLMVRGWQYLDQLKIYAVALVALYVCFVCGWLPSTSELTKLRE